MRSESVHLTKIFVCFADFAHARTHTHTHTLTHTLTHTHTHTYTHTHTHAHASKQASWPGQQGNFIYNTYMSDSIFRSTTIFMLFTGSHSISSWHI